MTRALDLHQRASLVSCINIKMPAEINFAPSNTLRPPAVGAAHVGES